jgi:tetraacyldisaccharide 4'-kinase
MPELQPTPLTVPLSWIYGGVSALYHGAFDTGFRKPADLGVPVISVGNLVVGGTGKTPVVLSIARAFLERGLVAAILTRGYGGSRTGLLQDGRWESGDVAGREAGDEPLHLSRCLPGVTLGIGRHRAQMGRRVLERQRVDAFLLDDGFQHRELYRQANVLLLDAEKPFGNNLLLPAGPLREPPSAMQRATAILLTGGDGSVSESTRRRLHAFKGPLWGTRLVLDHFETLEGERCSKPEGPVLAVGGIARPERLHRFLQAEGLQLIGLQSFPDHHPYTEAEVRALESMNPGAVLVTTAKDAVRLVPLVSGNAEWRVATISIDIEGGWNAFLERILPELFPKKGAERPGGRSE